MVEFKELKLSEVFKKESIQRGKRIVKNDRKPGIIPLVTAGKENYGVSGYIKEHTAYSEGNVMTIDMFGNVFYREYGFFFDDNIIVFDEEFTKGVYLYLTSTLSKLSHLHGYSKQFRYKDISDTNVSIPINPDGTPDFQYMENYIKEIEQKYISNLKQKLETDKTNLLKVIGKSEEDIEEVLKTGFDEASDFKEFKVGNLFGFKSMRQIPRGYVPKLEEKGKYPYVTQKSTNRGVTGYMDYTDTLELVQEPMIVLGVDNIANGVCYWYEEPFYANKMMGLTNDRLNSKSAHYIITILLSQYRGYSYQHKISKKVVEETYLSLPVKQEGTPDFEYMERYISYIELAHTHTILSKLNKKELS